MHHREKIRKYSTSPLADKVAQHVITLFHRVADEPGETVVAAFVLVRGDEIRVASWAYGTHHATEVGDRRPRQELVDFHAEILARRGFQAFVWAHLEDPLFVIDGNWQSDWTIHLYVSTTPCGNASWPRFAKSSPPTMADDWPRVPHERMSMGNRGMGEVSVSLKSRDPSVFPAFGNSQVRLSCSDKILKWNAVGLEGALLSHVIQPLSLTSVIIGRKFNEKRAKRALCCRLFDLPGIHHPAIMTTRVPLSDGLVYENEAAQFSKNWGLYVDQGQGLACGQHLTSSMIFQTFESVVPDVSYERAKLGSPSYQGRRAQFLCNYRVEGAPKYPKPQDFLVYQSENPEI